MRVEQQRPVKAPCFQPKTMLRWLARRQTPVAKVSAPYAILCEPLIYHPATQCLLSSLPITQPSGSVPLLAILPYSAKKASPPTSPGKSVLTPRGLSSGYGSRVECRGIERASEALQRQSSARRTPSLMPKPRMQALWQGL